MVDLFGQELALGDTIAFNPPFYKGLMMGKLVKFTPKQIKLNSIIVKQNAQDSS